MAAGGGATYPEVVRLLKEKVAQKGQRTVSRETGIALLSIQRYLKGQGEPTTATLQKLADYFGVSVAYLRGYNEGIEIKSLLDDTGLRFYDYIKNGIRVRLDSNEVETIGLCYLECRKTGDMSMVENYIKKLESRCIPDHLL